MSTTPTHAAIEFAVIADNLGEAVKLAEPIAQAYFQGISHVLKAGTARPDQYLISSDGGPRTIPRWEVEFSAWAP